jgi:hypothetical protein
MPFLFLVMAGFLYYDCDTNVSGGENRLLAGSAEQLRRPSMYKPGQWPD